MAQNGGAWLLFAKQEKELSVRQKRREGGRRREGAMCLWRA